MTAKQRQLLAVMILLISGQVSIASAGQSGGVPVLFLFFGVACMAFVFGYPEDAP